MINYLRNEHVTLPAYCDDKLWALDVKQADSKVKELLNEVRCHDHRIHRSSGLNPEHEALEQTAYAITDFQTHIGRPPTNLEKACLKIHFLEIALIGIYIGNKYEIGQYHPPNQGDAEMINYPLLEET